MSRGTEAVSSGTEPMQVCNEVLLIVSAVLTDGLVALSIDFRPGMIVNVTETIVRVPVTIVEKPPASVFIAVTPAFDAMSSVNALPTVDNEATTTVTLPMTIRSKEFHRGPFPVLPCR